MLTNKFNISSIIYIVIGLFLYLETVAPHTIFSQIAMFIAFVTCSAFGVLSYRNKEYYLSLKVNPLIICYFLFMVYQIVITIISNEYKTSLVLSDLLTMSYCLLITIAMYNFFINGNRFKNFEVLFIVIGVLSSISILFLCREYLGEGRLAHSYDGEGQSYDFLGTKVMISSNGLASVWALACFFLFNRMLTNKSFPKKILMFLIVLLLSVCVFLTGSRKGFLVLILCVLMSILLYGKSRLSFKLLIGLFIAFSVYFILTKVEFFRNIIGERLEELIIGMFSNEASSEGSITARKYYSKMAIKAFNSRKLFGYGIGWFNNEFGNITENEYLEILVSGGIFGFIIYFAYIPYTIYKILMKSEKNKNILKYFSVFTIFLIIMYGSVIMYSRSYLLYLSMIYMSLEMHKTNKKSISIQELNKE